MLTKVPGTNRAIFRTTLGRMVRGAIFAGLFASLMMALQGYAIAKTYTTPQSRQQFAATLTSVPALGVLYGEPLKVDTTAGYMIYRVMPIATLVSAVWGLLAITKLLRGQEEDGRWELMLSGQTTVRRATLATLGAAGVALLIAWVVAGGIIAGIGATKDIALPFDRALVAGAGAILPAAVFMGVGALTSQLVGTRRRAILFGLVPLLALYLLRSVANVVPDVSWLKYFTPFGWVDRLHIVTTMQPLWLLALAALAVGIVAVGVLLAGKRDLGQSLLTERDVTPPHYALLAKPWQFALRMSRTTMVGWLLAGVTIVSMIAALAKVATKAVNESASLSNALAALAGHQHQIDLSFLGSGTLFLGLVLLSMVTVGMASIRDDEARGYADNILVNPVPRTHWLCGRVALLLAAALCITLVASTASWLIANGQGISVSAGMIGDSLSLLAPITLLLGIGTLLYGWRPRLAVPVMAAYIVWSFAIDLLGSVIHLNSIVAKTSLLQYVPLVPAQAPNWVAFGVVFTLGVAAAACGVALFNKRDIEAE